MSNAILNAVFSFLSTFMELGISLDVPHNFYEQVFVTLKTLCNSNVFQNTVDENALYYALNTLFDLLYFLDVQKNSTQEENPEHLDRFNITIESMHQIVLNILDHADPARIYNVQFDLLLKSTTDAVSTKYLDLVIMRIVICTKDQNQISGRIDVLKIMSNIQTFKSLFNSKIGLAPPDNVGIKTIKIVLNKLVEETGINLIRLYYSNFEKDFGPDHELKNWIEDIDREKINKNKSQINLIDKRFEVINEDQNHEVRNENQINEVRNENQNPEVRNVNQNPEDPATIFPGLRIAIKNTYIKTLKAVLIVSCMLQSLKFTVFKTLILIGQLSYFCCTRLMPCFKNICCKAFLFLKNYFPKLTDKIKTISCKTKSFYRVHSRKFKDNMKKICGTVFSFCKVHSRKTIIRMKKICDAVFSFLKKLGSIIIAKKRRSRANCLRIFRKIIRVLGANKIVQIIVKCIMNLVIHDVKALKFCFKKTKIVSKKVLKFFRRKWFKVLILLFAINVCWSISKIVQQNNEIIHLNKSILLSNEKLMFKQEKIENHLQITDDKDQNTTFPQTLFNSAIKTPLSLVSGLFEGQGLFESQGFSSESSEKDSDLQNDINTHTEVIQEHKGPE